MNSLVSPVPLLVWPEKDRKVGTSGAFLNGSVSAY